MSRWVWMVVMGVALACSSDDLSKADTSKLLEGLDAARVAPPDDQAAMLAATCAEIEGCAQGCAAGLKAYAAATPETRPDALADGCAAAKAHVKAVVPAQREKAATNFVIDRVSRFVAKATGNLDGADKKRLNEARAVLKL